MAAATLGTSCTPGANASISYHKNAIAIEVGQSVYLDEADNYRLKLADDSSATKADAQGHHQRMLVWNGHVENTRSSSQSAALFFSRLASNRVIVY